MIRFCLNFTLFFQLLLKLEATPNELLRLFTFLGSQKYRLYAYQVNGHNIGQAQYSFIHSNCTKLYGTTSVATYLDVWTDANNEKEETKADNYRIRQ